VQQQDPFFNEIVYLHDYEHNQAFFIHASCALRTARYYVNHEPVSATSHQGGLVSDTLLATFIQLKEHSEPTLVCLSPWHSGDAGRIQSPQCSRPSLQLVEVIQDLSRQLSGDQIPVSISLPAELRFTELVPLAALLLEYPVAYVPSSEASPSSLSHRPLDVYECVLNRGPDEHVLLKFSCPSDLTPASLTEVLNMHFITRADCFLPGWNFSVRHSTVVLDAITM
jgi:hypothetical protein